MRRPVGLTPEQIHDQQRARIETIERAKSAALSLGYVQEPIERMKADLVVKLINFYRAGELAHERLIGIAAELSAYDRILEDLRSEVQQGETASKKEYE